MKNKSKGCIITIGLIIIFFSFPPAIKVRATEIKAEKDVAVYIYPGAVFTKVSLLKKGVVKKEYCSEDAIRFIKKYYKRKYPDAVEITVGTKEGSIQKLLLDVKSPLDRHKSRKSISLFTSDKKGKCRTVIWIEELSKEEIKETVHAPPPDRKAEDIKEKEPSQKNIGLGIAFNAVNTSAGPAFFFGHTPASASRQAMEEENSYHVN